MQPVPAVGGITDFEKLQDTDEHVGVVVRQSAGQQTVDVVMLNVETATRREKNVFIVIYTLTTSLTHKL